MKLRMAGASDSAAGRSSRGSAYVWKSLEPLALPDLDGEVGHGRGLSMGRDLRPGSQQNRPVHLSSVDRSSLASSAHATGNHRWPGGGQLVV